jgi:hypothetical protein
VGGPKKPKTPFSASKKHGGGDFEKITKGFLGLSVHGRAVHARGVGAELAFVSIFLESGFEQSCKIPPT